MLTVAVFLVSGLVLTVLLGVGYLWRRWSCPGCHGNCHFHCCYGNSHISSCRRLLLQLGWWQRRSNPPDNADCHGKKRVDKPTSPNNSTNRTIIHDDRDDIDDDKLSSGQSDKLMMMLQQQQHHKQEHQNQQQSSRSSVSPLASQMMLDVCHSNTPGIDLDVNIGLVNSMMLKQMMLTNPSSLSTQTPLQAPTLLYTNQSGVLEIECSSTDSGRGASDENQQLSLMIPDKSAALLSQMSPQFCCYTLLPTSSSCSTDPRNQPSYMQHPLLVSAAALESPPHSSPSPILAYPPTSFPDLYHTLLPSTNSDQYPSSSLQSYLNSLSQHHYNKPHQHLPELLPIISSDLLSPSNSNEEAMTTATMATDSVQTTDSCSNNECSHCLQHQMLTNTSTNLSYSDTSLLFHHYK